LSICGNFEARQGQLGRDEMNNAGNRAKGFGIRTDERTAMFIDGPNIYRAAKALDIDLDYRAILDHFRDGSKFLRAYYYTTVAEGSGEALPIQALFDWLEYNGFTLLRRTMRKFTDHEGREKTKGGSFAVDLTIDVMEIAARIDHVVLFTGDLEYVRLVEVLKGKGVRTTLASSAMASPALISHELRRVCDSFVELGDVADIISRKDRATHRVMKST
jgi:uncharacterized LabA/DUF88 family protein